MKIHNLTTQEDGVLSGPMSPLLFAKEICGQLDINLTGLARVHWDDDRTMQYIDEESGLDTLVVCEDFKNDTVLFLFLDTGVGGMPVAFRTREDAEITYTPIYNKSNQYNKPSENEVAQVFETIFSDMSLITPRTTS